MPLPGLGSPAATGRLRPPCAYSSEGEALATQPKEISVAIASRFSGGEELLQRVRAAASQTLLVVLMTHGNTGSRGFPNVERRTIPAKHLRGRPLGQHWNCRRCVWRKFLGSVNDFSTHDRQDGFDVLDRFVRRRKEIVGERDQVCELTAGRRHP